MFELLNINRPPLQMSVMAVYFYGAVGGTRTHMISRSILSAVRIPISPQRHKLFNVL